MVSAKRGEKIAITVPSSIRPPANSISNTSPSPSAARAGHQTTLSLPGAKEPPASDVSTANRDSVPEDRMAAICSAMTKPAPMTAETICATSRVRLGPIRRNSSMVIAIAIAEADRPIATTTPKAASQRGPPQITSTSTNGVDSNSAMRDDRQRDRGDADRKDIGQLHRRRHDQVEIGAGIKYPRHRFDRLRQHQGPGQQDGRGDDDQRGFVERQLQVGEAADHRIGRQMHDRRQTSIRPISARLRLRRPAVIIASHSRHASRISCRANQLSAVAELMRRQPRYRPAR